MHYWVYKAGTGYINCRNKQIIKKQQKQNTYCLGAVLTEVQLLTWCTTMPSIHCTEYKDVRVRWRINSSNVSIIRQIITFLSKVALSNISYTSSLKLTLTLRRYSTDDQHDSVTNITTAGPRPTAYRSYVDISHKFIKKVFRCTPFATLKQISRKN